MPTKTKKPQSVTTLDAALALVNSGFSVIPVGGEKKPAVPWKVYQERRPTRAELARWFNGTDNRVGVVTGEVSGNLEVLDFDDTDAFQAFKAVVNSSQEAADAAGRCMVVRTPSGGYHVWYRLPQPVPGNRVLARAGADRGVRIETRGEGGYVLAPPSAGYELLHGAPDSVPVLTDEQHEVLLRMARSYNQVPEEEYHGYQDPPKNGELRPGDDFNARPETLRQIRDLLKDAGWKSIGERGDNELWQRPGKDGDGPSATLNAERGCFYVFSSNAQPFAPNKGYSYFSVYAILKHNSDFRAAASELARQGFGDDKDAGGVELIADGFGTLLPINSHILPRFPVHALAPWQRDFVEAVSLSTQTPVDLPAILSMATVAACLSKTIEVAPRPDWTEQVNIYTVCALGPGTRKSSAFALCAKPLLEYERRVNREAALGIAMYQDQKALLEGEIERLRKTPAKAEVMEETVEALRQKRIQLEELERNAVQPVSLVVQDATPEVLASLMARHNGKMAILSADTDVFSMMAGKYSGGTPNLEVYLMGHAGDDMKVHRIGREPDIIEKPALTLGLAVQPDVLHGLMKRQGFRGRGIIGRWLYSMPEDLTGFRDNSHPPVSTTQREAYGAVIELMARMKPGQDEFGRDEPYILTFEPDANLLFWEFAAGVEYRQRPGEDLEDMRDWASKLHGMVARLSALLHICWNVDKEEPWSVPISADTMRRALAIACYATHHAKATFEEMGADETMNKARRLVEWIKRSGTEEFTKRQAYTMLPHIFLRTEDMDAPLALLLERGYLREHKPDHTPRAGRKPGSRFEVNPRLWADKHTANVVQVPFEEVCKDGGK